MASVVLGVRARAVAVVLIGLAAVGACVFLYLVSMATGLADPCQSGV